MYFYGMKKPIKRISLLFYDLAESLSLSYVFSFHHDLHPLAYR